MLKKTFHIFLAVFGFLLSPLSWWNDLVFNIPISYFLAYPFGLINKEYFYPALVIIYWITNVVGILFMQVGIKGYRKKQHTLTKKDLVNNLLFCCLYSLLIVVLIRFGIIAFPVY